MKLGEHRAKRESGACALAGAALLSFAKQAHGSCSVNGRCRTVRALGIAQMRAAAARATQLRPLGPDTVDRPAGGATAWR